MHPYLRKAEKRLEKLLEMGFSMLPRPRPRRDKIAQTRIISHRGDRTGGALENTREAFEHALEYGVWGLETDVHFTRDNTPILHHDPTLMRVYGQPLTIAETSYRALKRAAPSLMTLEEFISAYSSRAHLMIELKHSLPPLNHERWLKVRGLLSHLRFSEDFHLLSLSPSLLMEATHHFPSRALLPVARWNVEEMSSLAVRENCGGLASHYFFLSEAVKARHMIRGQMLGTGQVNSLYNLWREIERGIDWIFSDRAALLQSEIRRSLDSRRQSDF